jgi:hypothetical protein
VWPLASQKPDARKIEFRKPFNHGATPQQSPLSSSGLTLRYAHISQGIALAARAIL